MPATPGKPAARSPWRRVALALALIAALIVAIGLTPAENNWLMPGLILALVYAAVPLLLFSLRDALAHSLAAWQQRRRLPAAVSLILSPGWLLLHVCALFALALGVLLAWLMPMDAPALSSWWLVLILPALVYAVSLLMTLQANSWRVLRWLWQQLKS